MNGEVLEKLIQFIIGERWEYDFPLTRATLIEKELKITGDDAMEFLIAYGRKFNVNLSHFMAADYFNDEGIVILQGILRAITGRERPPKKNLTVGHLEKGIHMDRLDEEVINNKI